MAKQKFVVNESSQSSRMIQCVAALNSGSVKRVNVGGVEHIVVTSYTLPDNIVMNGILYPVDEVNESFHMLERTLAPIGHPQDSDGNFISALDPHAIHNYHAGAFNTNVQREGNRIRIDKTINVQEAMKTERGRRLLDRVEELETNENPRPIHTSTGLLLEIELLEETRTNDCGQEYKMIGRNMVWDHDAILLDEVGAAQPHQGVGMAINKGNKDIQVDKVFVNQDEQTEIHKMSMREKHDAVQTALEKEQTPNDNRYIWITDLYEDRVIYDIDGATYEVPYALDESTGIATIVGVPLPVQRNVTYTPKTNSQTGEAMKEKMLAALQAAGIAVNSDWSDDEIFEKYNALMANQNNSNNAGENNIEADLADVIANAVKNAVEPVANELKDLKSQVTANQESELDGLVSTIVNSGRHPELEEGDIKLLPLATVKKMAANCVPSYGGVIPAHNSGEQSSEMNTEMPK